MRSGFLVRATQTHTHPYAVINTDKQDGKLLNILMPPTSSVGIDTRT